MYYVEEIPKEVLEVIAWALFANKAKRDGFLVEESASVKGGWFAMETADPTNRVTVWREGSRLRAI